MSDPIRVAVAGAAGRMGRRVVAIASQDSQIEIVAALESAGCRLLGQDAGVVAGGEKLELAGLEIDVLLTPGHSPGHVSFSIPSEGALFSGDVLFAGSVGRTDLPGGNPGDMLNSLRTKVLPLPDSVVVLPGHGPQTTMARERAANPYLQEML